jgi:hypothetical protein
MERPRKAPAVERRVSDIDPSDIKVRVLGTVARKGDGFFVLKDETGEIKIKTSQEASPKSLVRVFGRPSKTGEKLELEADLVQDMTGLDKKLYKKLHSLD